MKDRSELLAKILKFGFPDKEVVLTLDEFFDDNHDWGSIGVNLYPDQPSPQEFYKTFKALLAGGRVDDVFVRIGDVEDVDWFFSDQIYVVGKITLEDLQQAVVHLQPTEIYRGWSYDFPANLSDNYQRAQAYSLWWD